MVNFNLQGLSDPNSLPATTQPAQPVKDEFAMPSLSDTLKPHELELINQTFPEGSTPGAKSELESLVSGAKATGTTPQGVFAEREAQKASDNAMSVATEATPDTMLADQVSKFSGNLDMLKELHPDAGNLTIDQMRAVIGQSASIPQYQYKPPTLMENLAAGLAMMLAPNSNPLGHITASHTKDSQDQYARDVQQYQMEQGAKQQQFQNLHNMASLQMEGVRIANQASEALARQGELKSQHEAQHLNDLRDDYARNPTEQLRAQMNVLLSKNGFPPIDNEHFAQDVATFNNKRHSAGVDQWEKVKRNQINSYGFLPEEFTGTREAIAREYGIDLKANPMALSPVTGTDSLRKQYQDQHKSELDRTFTAREAKDKVQIEKWKADMADMLSRRQMEGERIQLAREHASIYGDNSNVERAYKRYQMSQKSVEDLSDKAEQKLKHEIAKKDGEINAAIHQKDEKSANKSRIEREGLQAELGYLELAKKPTIDLSMFGGSSAMPNPAYQTPKKGKSAPRVVDVPYKP